MSTVKVSELVKLRELLQTKYNTGPLVNELEYLNSGLMTVGKETAAEELGIEIQELAHDLNRIHNNIRFNKERFDFLINELDKEISKDSHKFLTDNYSLEIQVEDEAIDIIRNGRILDISTEVQEIILNRIRLYTHWKYPALEIGCRDGEWTKFLVAADPLYITDHYQEFLDSTLNNFNEDYRRRVRPYLTRDSDLSSLPQGQFGFVFSWNFLNYRSLDSVKEYIKSVWDLLRPGGVFLFSYNNGDLYECVAYAESRGQSYIPKSLLVPMFESLGFDLEYSHEIRGQGTTVNWVEIKKPGELDTIRRHQTLGEIKLRTDIQV